MGKGREHLDKKTGVVYIYETQSFWNPQKNRKDRKQFCIGRRDPQTHEFVPNRNYYWLYGDKDEEEPSPVPVPEVLSSQNFGNIALLQHAADESGLTSVLKECFPNSWSDILSCAMYCASENAPLYLCAAWARDSYGISAPSPQRISELLRGLYGDKRMRFYRKWADLRSESTYRTYDISSGYGWA